VGINNVAPPTSETPCKDALSPVDEGSTRSTAEDDDHEAHARAVTLSMDACFDELASSSDDDEAFPAILDLQTIVLPGKDEEPPTLDSSYDRASAFVLQPLPHHVFTIPEISCGSDGPSGVTGR
jgi:hypothetical protein